VVISIEKPSLPFHTLKHSLANPQTFKHPLTFSHSIGGCCGWEVKGTWLRTEVVGSTINFSPSVRVIVIYSDSDKGDLLLHQIIIIMQILACTLIFYPKDPSCSFLQTPFTQNHSTEFAPHFLFIRGTLFWWSFFLLWFTRAVVKTIDITYIRCASLPTLQKKFAQ